MSKHPDNRSQKNDKSRIDDLSTRNPSVDWIKRNSFPKNLLNGFERLSLIIESPISRWVRESKFNPLYHTGTITILLLFIILGTGIYLTLFYQFGFEASYQAVENIEANFVGRVMRALHRYASGAAVIFGLLHGWRTFFQDRFRGPRWLAWTTGIGMASFVWLIGVTGYWLIWDQRAAVLNQTLINLINSSKLGTNFLVKYLVTEQAGSGWIFLLLVITIHLGLSTIVGLFFWWHIKRLTRAKWLPPNYWIIVICALLVLASIILPIGMLAPINPAQLSSAITIDPFYLFYLPGAIKQSALLFWGGMIAIIGLVAAIPWLLTRKKLPPVKIDPNRCTGCTLCAADCPYKAIQMVERTDGRPHKFLAEIDPKMCVACGICIGTCTPLAMTFGETPAEPMWQETLLRISDSDTDSIKIVFTCERHAAQGAKSYYRGTSKSREDGGPLVQIVPLTCIGMAHPDLATKALDAGASEVHFIGCPPEDCANREGNLWLQDRVSRERLPKLKSNYANESISTDWLSPNEFSKALENPNTHQEATAYNLSFKQIKWLKFTPAIILLGLVLGIQIWLSDVNYNPFPENSALLEFSLTHRSGLPIKEIAANLESKPGIVHPTRITIEIDGRTKLDKSFYPQGSSAVSLAFEQIPLPAGEHHIRLSMFDRPQQAEALVLYDQVTKLSPHQVLRLNYTSQQLGGDSAAGEKIFNDRSIGTGGSCSLCHSLETDEIFVGPSLSGIAIRAGERIEGMGAEEYLRESILDPNAYIVEGYPAGQMLPDLDKKLSPTQIDDLIAFLLTRK